MIDKVRDAHDTIKAYNENAKDANLDYALSLLDEVIDELNPPKPETVVVYYRVYRANDFVIIHYELHERGSGILELYYELPDLNSPLARLLGKLQESFGFPMDYRVSDWEDPPDSDGEPMQYKLILNPSEDND